MRKSLKTIPALLLAGIFLCVSCLPAQAQSLESAPPIQLTAPSYLLADAETGAIIFEKDADTPRQVASLTKLMTVLPRLHRAAGRRRILSRGGFAALGHRSQRQ